MNDWFQRSLISNCLSSSRENTINLSGVKRFDTKSINARPNEPVPPVTSTFFPFRSHRSTLDPIACSSPDITEGIFFPFVNYDFCCVPEPKAPLRPTLDTHVTVQRENSHAPWGKPCCASWQGDTREANNAQE